MSDTPRTDKIAEDMEHLGPGGRKLHYGKLWGLARDLERENARLLDENAQVLQENLRLRKLVEEVISTHADPESPWWNECSMSSPCAWCDAAYAALTPQQPEREDK